MIEDFTLKRLTADHALKGFDCGDDDLNEFFHEDAKKYLDDLLAVTYVFEDGKRTAAFFSVLNDKITNEDAGKNHWFTKLVKKSKIPDRKRRSSYPAVKVGRFGVHKDLRGKGLGSEILDFIKGWFILNNKTGCRYITVNAYNCESVTGFYKKNGFEFLTSTDKEKKTRLMYFDLIRLRP